mgnify:CR=1 FL=1
MPEGTGSPTGIGASVKRKEDFRFLTGRGTYTDDINRPGQTYAYILRSPHASADIVKIDAAKAKAAPGVVAILTGADYDKGGLPCGWQIHSKDGSPMIEPPHFPLCKDKVRHVGDQVALVVAETYAQARDAAELIEVTYKETKPIVSLADADKPGQPQVWASSWLAFLGVPLALPVLVRLWGSLGNPAHRMMNCKPRAVRNHWRSQWHPGEGERRGWDFLETTTTRRTRRRKGKRDEERETPKAQSSLSSASSAVFFSPT